MEELRKLEKVQRMVEFMESRGISNSDHHHNRFLTNFMIFLIEPCDELGMDDKCGLISGLMPRLSSALLQDAYQLVTTQQITYTGGQQNHVGNALLSCDQMKEENLLQSYNENMAMVRLDSMQKANSTLDDFCRSYFMFHGLDLDKMNENLLQTLNNRKAVFGEGNSGRIREELRHGEEYWALERKLCCALINKEEILVEDVMKAIHLKSFDYRVLNLLLYQLRGAEVEELHMEFLSISEFLVEVSDDLYDYEEDVLENNFNILRMFIRIYGAQTAPAMLAKCISEAEDKYESLLKLLDPHLSMSYQKRCVEATKEGGKVSEHPLGTWSIPTMILDEELYRSKLKSDIS